MGYTKTSWTDRNVSTPSDYTITKSGGGALSSGDVVTMAESPGTVTDAGTDITQARMNNIETGIYNIYYGKMRKIRMGGMV